MIDRHDPRRFQLLNPLNNSAANANDIARHLLTLDAVELADLAVTMAQMDARRTDSIGVTLLEAVHAYILGAVEPVSVGDWTEGMTL